MFPLSCLVVPVAMLAATTSHMVAQSPEPAANTAGSTPGGARSPAGYMWEAAISGVALLGSVVAAIWVNSYISSLAKESSPIAAWPLALGACATGLLIVQFVVAHRFEQFSLRRLTAYIPGLLIASLGAMSLTWVDDSVALPIQDGLTFGLFLVFLILAIAIPQDPGNTFTAWLGIAAGLVVLTARRGKSVEALGHWHLAIAVGLVVTTAVLLLATWSLGPKLKAPLLRRVARGTLAVSAMAYMALAFAQR